MDPPAPSESAQDAFECRFGNVEEISDLFAPQEGDSDPYYGVDFGFYLDIPESTAEDTATPQEPPEFTILDGAELHQAINDLETPDPEEVSLGEAYSEEYPEIEDPDSAGFPASYPEMSSPQKLKYQVKPASISPVPDLISGPSSRSQSFAPSDLLGRPLQPTKEGHQWTQLHPGTVWARWVQTPVYSPLMEDNDSAANMESGSLPLDVLESSANAERAIPKEVEAQLNNTAWDEFIHYGDNLPTQKPPSSAQAPLPLFSTSRTKDFSWNSPGPQDAAVKPASISSVPELSGPGSSTLNVQQPQSIIGHSAPLSRVPVSFPEVPTPTFQMPQDMFANQANIASFARTNEKSRNPAANNGMLQIDPSLVPSTSTVQGPLATHSNTASFAPTIQRSQTSGGNSGTHQDHFDASTSTSPVNRPQRRFSNHANLSGFSPSVKMPESPFAEHFMRPSQVNGVSSTQGVLQWPQDVPAKRFAGPNLANVIPTAPNFKRARDTHEEHKMGTNHTDSFSSTAPVKRPRTTVPNKANAVPSTPAQRPQGTFANNSTHRNHSTPGASTPAFMPPPSTPGNQAISPSNAFLSNNSVQVGDNSNLTLNYVNPNNPMNSNSTQQQMQVMHPSHPQHVNPNNSTNSNYIPQPNQVIHPNHPVPPQQAMPWGPFTNPNYSMGANQLIHPGQIPQSYQLMYPNYNPYIHPHPSYAPSPYPTPPRHFDPKFLKEFMEGLPPNLEMDPSLPPDVAKHYIEKGAMLVPVLEAVKEGCGVEGLTMKLGDEGLNHWVVLYVGPPKKDEGK